MSKILVIDDDQMMLSALRTLLESEDFEVMTSTDGDGGVRMYRENRPAAVLLDLRLPNKSGIDVLKEIILADKAAKVIIITGYPSAEVREETMSNGAFYFYEKNRDVAELLDAIQRALAAKPA